MSDERRDDIYDEPTVPDALECPHCQSIIPPHSSKCQNCGKEFEWGQARQILIALARAPHISNLLEYIGGSINAT